MIAFTAVTGALAAFIGIYSCWLLVRNRRVHQFRVGIIHQIGPLADADIVALHPWMWRYKAYESVSYERMLFSLRPLQPEAFYDDTSFLQATTCTCDGCATTSHEATP